MSAWRRKAIQELPHLRSHIERSDSVGMLWTKLWLIFVEANSDPKDDATIRGTYNFALWCVAESHDDQIATSTVCHFYEHLPSERPVRKELPKHMTTADFLGMKEVFKYHMTPEEHEAFLNEFLEHRKLIGREAV